MIETSDRLKNGRGFRKNPYENLYIYYVEGHLKPGSQIPGKDFIGNWEEDTFSFLFFSKPAHDDVKTLLHAQPQLTLLDQYHMTYEQWQGERFAPFRVGRFVISPPWDSMEKKVATSDGDLEILLDPGVVFGTGTHPTTHDCLDALERAFRDDRPRSALDLGTGTGLLALAAARLGCQRTLAVDFNFLAARTARENTRLNRIEDKVGVVQGLAEDFIDCHADLLIANIHFDVMKNLIRSKGFLRKRWFILSGLLRSQAGDVAHILSQYPVKILQKWERDSVWYTFFGKSCAPPAISPA